MSTATAWAPAPEDLEAYRATSAPTRNLHAAHLAADRITFAKGDLDLIEGMAVVKPGIFNGVFEVTRDDLDVWVARFDELIGTFRPPLRLDHSWDVLSVIGRFEALRVENRPDPTIGGTIVPMLVGDVRLVGTASEKDLVREWITGDKLNERSSEFWAYRTNAGADYPSIFAGTAFVDIPAVEGLGGITLRRASTLSATPQEGTTVSTTTTETAPVVQTEPPAEEVTPTVAEVTPTGVDVEGETAPEGEAMPEGETAPVETPPEGERPPAGEIPPDLDAVAERLRAAGDKAQALASLELVVEQRVALRVQAETRLSTQTARGVVTPGIREHVEKLLRHGEQSVRDAAYAILEAAAPPVTLRAGVGTLGTTTPSGTGVTPPDELRELSAAEFGPKWAELTTETRKSPEYLAAYRDVMGTDYRSS